MDCLGDYDGACIQMRVSYSPVANLFLFLVQWSDCHLAGALGLLRILIYKVGRCLGFNGYTFALSIDGFVSLFDMLNTV